MSASLPLVPLVLRIALDEIVEHLRYHQAALARLCLVSRDWHGAARPVLYSWLRLREVGKCERMLTILASSQELCALLRHLEIRVWPLASDTSELELLATTVLHQASGLTTLHWTRHHSLSNDLLDAIATISTLRHFETNASAGSSWSPARLLAIRPQLHSLSLIMPDRSVVDIVPELLRRQTQLRDLSILSLESTCVTDTTLVRPMTAALGDEGRTLRSLALTGAPKLSDEAMLALLKTIGHGLEHLAIEASGTSPGFVGEAARHLPVLRSLKVTHPGTRHARMDDFFPALSEALLACPRLCHLVHYASGSNFVSGRREWPVLDPMLIEACARRSLQPGFAPMRRFEVQGVLASVDLVGAIVHAMPLLRDFVIHVWERDPFRLANILAGLQELRTLHIMAQRDFSDHLQDIAERCAPTLTQIGLRQRVFNVVRKPQLELEPYTLPIWPEVPLQREGRH